LRAGFTHAFKAGLESMVNEGFADLQVTAFQGTTVTRVDPEQARA
jgi:hypothetical protein